MLTARDSKLKLAGLLLGVVLFVLLGVWMGLSAETLGNRIIGWLGAAFFGLGCLSIPKRLLSSKRREVTISSIGISDSHWKIGTIPWSEFTGAWIGKIKGNKVICFSLRQPEVTLSELSPTGRKLVLANRALGFGDFQIMSVGLDKSADELLQEILRYLPIPV
jgi:hypothetical protein